MHAGRIRSSHFLVATVAAAVAALVAGPAASAKSKAPERPKGAAAKRVNVQTLARAAATTEVLSIGYDGYSGLELFVTRVDGRIVGMPYG